jgi:DUF4097 and DUF4098 domain-containing protein YvlB
MKSLILSALVVSSLSLAQTAPTRHTIPLTDPGRPARVHIESVNGAIHVEGHAGKDVILEVAYSGAPRRERNVDTKGMKRLDLGMDGLEAEEQNNQVKIESGGPGKMDLHVLVPAQSSVKVESVDGGDLRLEGISGGVEAECVNGKIILNNLSGAVSAEGVNGGIVASFSQVAADKPVSLSTVNGAVEVTLPADVKAKIKMRSEHGGVMSDFDLKSESTETVTSGRDKSGKFKLTLGRSVSGAINGGGPELRIETVNGAIYLKKK